jgi:hypothetical protein
MRQTVTLSDRLYHRLSTEARRRGFKSIEEFLESWALAEVDLERRQATARSIRGLRDHFRAKYGPAPDSVGLIRADRMRFGRVVSHLQVNVA